MTQILEELKIAGEEFSKKLAVVCGDNKLTYNQLLDESSALAKKLEEHFIDKRNLVGIYQVNDTAYLLSYFALLFCGQVPILVDFQFSQQEIEYLHELGINYFLVSDNRDTFPLERCGSINLNAHCLLIKQLEIIKPPFRLRPDTAVCRLTSGSTGKPKCLEFSENAIINAAKNWQKGTDLIFSDNILCLSALSNGLAFNTSLLSAIMTGVTLHLLNTFLIPSFVANYISDHKITRLVAFPEFYKLLLRAKSIDHQKFKSLAYAISSGSKLSDSIRNSLSDIMGLPIVDYYGIAEVGPVTFRRDTDSDGLGKPLPNTKVKINDSDKTKVGEIMVKSSSMASCYLNFPGELERHIDELGYYKSGDIGYFNDTGCLFISGRIKDSIIVSGRTIDLTEILEYVNQIEGISDAAIFSDVNFHNETIIHLLVVSKKYNQKEDIIKALQNKISRYKIPEKISFVSKIRRNGIGKPIFINE